MTFDRLSAVDSSFLEIESPSAHMHVGWAAIFAPPEDGPAPSFEALRDHIAGRMGRAPRYRQRVAEVPLGLGNPVWADDERFDIDRHVRRAPVSDFDRLVGSVMSSPLDHARPLWELRIAEGLEGGRIGIVGKAHHCMVDGIAAVDLMALLLDATPTPPPVGEDGWRAEPRPGGLDLLAGAARERVGKGLELATLPLQLARRPGRLLEMPGKAAGAARALAHSLMPARSGTAINQPLSPERHLVRVTRPLEELSAIKRRFGTTLNDVVLAVCAGGMRRFLERRGEQPCPLKAMVPVSVRTEDGHGELGNRISFLFTDLPCEEPDPVRRLERTQASVEERKQGGDPQGADELLHALEYAPLTLQRTVSHFVASPSVFNLTISNIPGPADPLYMNGCELEVAHPVVPLAEGHGVAIGMASIAGNACFGIYADRRSVPDADVLAGGLEESIDELARRKAPSARRKAPGARGG